VQPIPEVRLAAAQLEALTGDVDLLGGLDVLAKVAQALVPSVVGVSLTVVFEGEPFTVTATDASTAALDAVQYLDGGPCLDAADDHAVVTVHDVLDERRWQLYRPAASALGVRASLSLPLGDGTGQVPGALNLYARDPDAFRGREAMLAEVFRAPADSFVTNADLSFTTRDAASALPDLLDQRDRFDQAVGMLIGRFGWSPEEASRRLRTAAARARTPLREVTDLLLGLTAE
jgi:GAF domain-containing protein